MGRPETGSLLRAWRSWRSGVEAEARAEDVAGRGLVVLVVEGVVVAEEGAGEDMAGVVGFFLCEV